MGTTLNTPRQSFIDAISVPDEHIDLTAAAVHIAREEYPDLDAVVYLGRISLLARRVRSQLSGRHSLYEALHAVNQVLYDEEGFAGNKDDYYDPRNSYLPDVLDRRLGIPISLSVIYAGIARKVGYRLRGVGMPGHFLLSAGHGAAEIFIDPFNRGGLLTRRECMEVASRGRGNGSPVSIAEAGKLLRVSGNRMTLRRMLANLKFIYLGRRDYGRALAAAERIQLMDPRQWRNLGDLARIHAELGQFAEAVDRLTAYLDRAPAGVDVSKARATLRQLRARMDPAEGRLR